MLRQVPSSVILLRSEALRPGQAATELVGRETQLRELSDCLAMRDGAQRATTAWLVGPPGSGKRTVANRVTTDACDAGGVARASVDCRVAATASQVLSEIMRQLGLVPVLGGNLWKVNALKGALHERGAVVLLSYFDALSSHDRTTCLNSLSSIRRLGLVCITTTYRAIVALSPDVAVSISPTIIRFEPFTVDEVEQVLEQRASRALRPGTWSRSALRLIAVASDGNLETAFDLLLRAAKEAERIGISVVAADTVRRVITAQEAARTLRGTELLPEPAHFLLRMAVAKGTLTSAEGRRELNRRLAHRGMAGYSPRTVQHYLHLLVAHGLARAERQPVHGNLWRYSPVGHQGLRGEKN